MGAFHSTQNSGNYRWYIKWNGPFRLGPNEIFGTSLEGGPVAFDEIVVPSTALSHPAYKNKRDL